MTNIEGWTAQLLRIAQQVVLNATPVEAAELLIENAKLRDMNVRLASEYLEMCDNGAQGCTGDDKAGIVPCLFYDFPDIGADGKPIRACCQLQQIVKEAMSNGVR